MPYAEGTSVAVEKSRAEIEGLLRKFWMADNVRDPGKYQGMRLGYYTDDHEANVTFTLRDKLIRLSLPLPDPSAERFQVKLSPHSHKRIRATPEQAYQAYEQACRERWRCLALSLKASLVDIEVGIKSFEVAFMPYFVMPDDKTLAEHILPRLDEVMSGKVGMKLLTAPN